MILSGSPFIVAEFPIDMNRDSGNILTVFTFAKITLALNPKLNTVPSRNNKGDPTRNAPLPAYQELSLGVNKLTVYNFLPWIEVATIFENDISDTIVLTIICDALTRVEVRIWVYSVVFLITKLILFIKMKK